MNFFLGFVYFGSYLNGLEAEVCKKKNLQITGKCKVFLLVWSLQKEYITVWKQYRVSMIFFAYFNLGKYIF